MPFNDAREGGRGRIHYLPFIRGWCSNLDSLGGNPRGRIVRWPLGRTLGYLPVGSSVRTSVLKEVFGLAIAAAIGPDRS